MNKWLLVFIDDEGIHGWLAYDSEAEAIEAKSDMELPEDSMWVYPPQS